MQTEKKYIAGQSRDHKDDHKVTHLYCGTFEKPGLPMCKRGWNRDDGLSYSIWRGNISEAGICKVCQRRANKNLDGIPRRQFTSSEMVLIGMDEDSALYDFM